MSWSDFAAVLPGFPQMAKMPFWEYFLPKKSFGGDICGMMMIVFITNAYNQNGTDGIYLCKLPRFLALVN